MGNCVDERVFAHVILGKGWVGGDWEVGMVEGLGIRGERCAGIMRFAGKVGRMYEEGVWEF